MSDIVRIVLLMYPALPLDAKVPEALLSRFEANPSFTPSLWGANERVRLPYSRKDALNQEGSPPGLPHVVFLHRQAVVKYGGYFDLDRRAYVNFDFHKSMPSKRWPELLELADDIASAIKPRFGILHIFRPTVAPWISETDRLVRWMTLAAYPVPTLFQPNGPLGLGMRTYFGSDILDMFGRDLLLSTPAQTQALDWGGIRLDLGEDLWNVDQSELAVRWKKAMDHLAPCNAIAEPVFKSDKQTVRFLPSPEWLKRAKAQVEA